MGKASCRVGAALATGLAALWPSLAQAHMVNADVGDFYAGMLHPLTSAEHLLPVLALAVLASQCGKKAGRLALLLFPASLMVGVLAGARAPSAFWAYYANVLGLVVLGGLLVIAPRVKPALVALAAAGLGLILGWRSGGDWAASTVGFQFVPGLALTGFVIVAVIAAWVRPAASGAGRGLRLAAGWLFVAAGLALGGQAFLHSGEASLRVAGLPTEESLTALAAIPKLSPPMVLGALVAAMAWGAGHALTPGHGKALVGAYLVGSRGTPWHALYLGLTVTVTHTLGVFLLGLVAWLAADRVSHERFYPWLGLASGLAVLILGGVLCLRRLRAFWHARDGHHHDHDHAHGGDHHHHEHSHGGHGHSHLPPGAHGEAVTWRSLLLLGVSGGMLPCPSALVLLLAAISFGRIGFGLLLVTAFSLGLAVVLTMVGLLFMKGGRMLERAPRWAVLGRFLPAGSAFVIFLLGAGITWEALAKLIGN